MTVERNGPHEAGPIAREICVRIADPLMPEKPSKIAVPAGILSAVATLLLLGLVLERTIHAAGGASGKWSFQIFLYAVLIALANNVDNLGARIAYSLQGTRVSVFVNLWISVITFVISFAAASLGTAAMGYFGTQVASVVAMVFLVSIGSWMILQAQKPAWREEKASSNGAATLWTVLLKPHRADVDRSRHIDFKEGTVLGIALSINNIGGGMSGGIVGVDPFLVALLSALVSFVALWAGNYMAEFFIRRNITEKAAVVGGALLIAIGIKQVF